MGRSMGIGRGDDLLKTPLHISYIFIQLKQNLYPKCSKMDKEKIDLHVLLHGELATKFLKIKMASGLKNSTEVIRYIIANFDPTTAKGG